MSNYNDELVADLISRLRIGIVGNQNEAADMITALSEKLAEAETDAKRMSKYLAEWLSYADAKDIPYPEGMRLFLSAYQNRANTERITPNVRYDDSLNCAYVEYVK